MDVVRPSILIDKTVSLNGQCPGQDSVTVLPGTTVTYCYVVTNTGDTPLSNVTVTDNSVGPRSARSRSLAPGASQNCTKTATITQSVVNMGTATGTPTDSQGNAVAQRAGGER